MSYTDSVMAKKKTKKETPKSVVSQLLAQFREARDLTQPELGKKIKASRSYVATVERAGSDKYHIEYVRKIWFMLNAEEKESIKKALHDQIDAELEGK
jgi:transcriptional regulator with XRE-family HTH domain